MVIVLMRLAMLTIPRNIRMFWIVGKMFRKAPEDVCVRFVRKIQHESELNLLNDDGGDIRFFKTSISGETTERENLLASNIGQLTVKESTETWV